VEVSALKPPAAPGLKTPAAFLRLQSDERLIAMIRRGQHAAFETLVGRYQSRLLAFCRHMLGSKEDAEDVLQEVFAAAFNAILADEREINVRPWLYRIARNRSLNHLRKASAIGVDSMDVHYAENGISTADKAMRRESFRQLIGDVQQLPETQRSALLLREIDALSYEQIAEAMDTTVPAVKSLLVRARVSLAEAAEARKLTCEEARLELGEVAEGLVKLSPAVRRHVRDCERCRGFRKHLKENNVALAAVMPVAPLLLVKKLVLSKLCGTAGAGGAHVAGAGAGGAGAAAGATAAGGATAGSGLLTAGAGALATKAVAGLAVAAIVTAGTVAAEHSAPRRSHRHGSALAATDATTASEPVVTRSVAQPISDTAVGRAHALALGGHAHRRGVAKTAAKKPKLLTVATSPATATAPAKPASGDAAIPGAATKPTAATPVTEVTSDSTELPSQQPQTGAPASSAQTPVAPPATTVSQGEAPTPPVSTPVSTTTTVTTPPPAPPPPASPPAGEVGQPAVTVTGQSPQPPSVGAPGHALKDGGTPAP
jgi:RNA polymerase sigma factor (sigma-70 family)